MTLPQSELPQRVTLEYWAKVRQLLKTRHGLSQTAAMKAIQTYQNVLSRTGVRDAIYHAPVDETAKGIVEGGYATDHASQRSTSTVGEKTEEPV